MELLSRNVFFASGSSNNRFINYEDFSSLNSSTNPVLLLHCNGTNNSTNFVDSSTYNRTITANPTSGPVISTTQSKFGGASGFFSGTDQYLVANSSSLWNLSSGNFTLEFWFYKTTNKQQVIVCQGNIWSLFLESNGTLVWAPNGIPSSGSIVYPFGLPSNQWIHIAIVRSGATITLYLDGSVVGTSTTNPANTNTELLFIGKRPGFSGTSWHYQGYIDELRLSRTARYTGAFTPPASPFSPDGSTDLLLHFDGVNNSTTFTDSSINNTNFSIDLPVISTAQSKFGGASGYFKGLGGYLTLPYTQSFNASNEFTIETWFNANTFSASSVLISKDTSGSSFDWCIQIVSATQIRCYTNGTVNSLLVTVPTMSTGTWYHVAFVRRNISGTLTNSIYLDGVSYGSNTMTVTNASQSFITIGCASWNNPNSFFNGYLDDLRISTTAVYSGNFTPPTSAFSDPTAFADLTLPSTSRFNNGVYLTDAINNISGNVWVKTLRAYNNDFTVEWTFECSGGSGADGFTLQWNTDISKIGGSGSSCGVATNSVNVVKFATFTNNNVSIAYNGSTFQQQAGSQLASPYWRQTVYYWAEYVHSSSQMKIYYSLTSTKPASPQHTFTGVVFSSTSYSMGLGAGTGATNDNHILKRWVAY